MKRRLLSLGAVVLVFALALAGCVAPADGTPPAAETPPGLEVPPTQAPEETQAPEATEVPGEEEPSDIDPSVTVEDQPLGEGDTVIIAEVVAAQQGWIVIHADDAGSPGPDIGWTAVMEGPNADVEVVLDQGEITERLYAMLHIDVGEMGTYEFPGPDAPARNAEGTVVTVPFMVTLPEGEAGAPAAPGDEGAAEGPSVTVEDQALGTGDTVTIAQVVAAQDGWIVIHADDNGAPGPDIGWAAVTEGVNEDVVVTLDQGDVTERLYAMLHIDVGEVGTYEFPGPDGPARDAEGMVVTVPFMVTTTAAVGEAFDEYEY